VLLVDLTIITSILDFNFSLSAFSVISLSSISFILSCIVIIIAWTKEKLRLAGIFGKSGIQFFSEAKQMFFAGVLLLHEALFYIATVPFDLHSLRDKIRMPKIKNEFK
jgi:uncharacterized membrane protein